MNIKEKYTPETHQTRCGKPWRWLELLGEDAIGITVGTTHPWEKVRYMYEDVALKENGELDEQFDFIKKEQSPVDLPTNLRPEIKWAAMRMGGIWVGYSGKPKVYGSLWDLSSDNYCSFQLSCLVIPTDPAGWENSLHELVDGMWRRAES